MRMKPKGDSSVGTGQRITQGDTILRGNEHVNHRLKEWNAKLHTITPLVKGPICPH
jgi:hypothetical protein